VFKPKAGGAVGAIEVWTEHLRANGDLFGVGVSDDYATTALFSGSPTRPGHVHDLVSYSVSPAEDSWNTRLHGAASPANTKSSKHEGQTT
jgi:hypothetical protein